MDFWKHISLSNSLLALFFHGLRASVFLPQNSPFFKMLFQGLNMPPSHYRVVGEKIELLQTKHDFSSHFLSFESLVWTSSSSSYSTREEQRHYIFAKWDSPPQSGNILKQRQPVHDAQLDNLTLKGRRRSLSCFICNYNFVRVVICIWPILILGAVFS